MTPIATEQANGLSPTYAKAQQWRLPGVSCENAFEGPVRQVAIQTVAKARRATAVQNTTRTSSYPEPFSVI